MTEQNERSPLSARSTSCIIRPYVTDEAPRPPYSVGMVGPMTPRAARPWATSSGNVSACACCSMTGITSSETYWRTRSRCAFSSSVRRSSTR